jgi:hypothetical protein
LERGAVENAFPEEKTPVGVVAHIRYKEADEYGF